MDIIFLAITGIIVGFLTSLFGIGGGVIIIPTLYFLFPSAVGPVVIATSLGIVGVTSTINSIYFHLQHKLPSIKFIIQTAVPMMIGIYIGKEIMLSLDTKMLKIIFGAFLLVISIKMGLEVKAAKHNDDQKTTPNRNIFLKSIGYIGAGILSGLTGLGGGIILIPLFKYFDGIPIRKLPAHTLPVVSIVAVTAIVDLMMTKSPTNTGFPSYFDFTQVGMVNVGIVAILCICAAIASKIGQSLIDIIPVKILKISLAFLLLVTSIKMLIW